SGNSGASSPGNSGAALPRASNPTAGANPRERLTGWQEAPMAVSSSFSSTTGLFSLIGDNAGNSLRISRNAAGKLLVNNGTVEVSGDTPTVANTSLLQVFGQGGND